MIIPVVTEDMIYFSKLKSLTNENYELLHVKRSEDMDKLNLDITKYIFVVDLGMNLWLDFGWVRGVLTLNPTRWGRVGLRCLPSRVGPQINPFWLHFGSPWACQIVQT